MENPSGAWRRDRYEKICKICYLRLQGNISEEEIATKVGFGSAEVMYEQLRHWGLPGWLVGSEPEDESAAPRKARASEGELIELPSAVGAAPLFKEVLKRLLADVGELPERLEYLKGGRFIVERDTSSDTFVGEVTTRLWRRDYSDEEWRRWCEERGEDPEAEYVDGTEYRGRPLSVRRSARRLRDPA
jgi:hypothetical protein